jgi:hypothetical protein
MAQQTQASPQKNSLTVWISSPWHERNESGFAEGGGPVCAGNHHGFKYTAYDGRVTHNLRGGRLASAKW